MAAATPGARYADVLEAAGGVAPFVWSQLAGDIPSGISIAADGLISGIPADQTPENDITVQVTDADGTTVTGFIRIPLSGFIPTALGNMVGWWKNDPITC
jgi:hypothetical protein